MKPNPITLDDIGTADHRRTEELLEEIDRLLRRRGLRLDMHDTGEDDYIFTINESLRRAPSDRTIRKLLDEQ